VDQRHSPRPQTVRLHQFRVRHHPHLVPGVNVVAVRVDNSLQPNSRWYTGSGIYRHVWLTSSIDACGPLGHLRDHAIGGFGPRRGGGRHPMENHYPTTRLGLLRSVVLDSAGQEVARAETSFSLPAGQSRVLTQRLEVRRPASGRSRRPACIPSAPKCTPGPTPPTSPPRPSVIRTIAYDKDAASC
jgi:beta-galactosidase